MIYYLAQASVSRKGHIGSSVYLSETWWGRLKRRRRRHIQDGATLLWDQELLQNCVRDVYCARDVRLQYLVNRIQILRPKILGGAGDRLPS